MIAPLLARSTFKTSRLLDFCSKRELVKQVGCDVDDWPLVILKELLDNSVDAAEEAGVAPVVTVDVAGGEIIVADNGPGIPPETITNILDYTSRTSSREAYVSPSRGQQGNALQTILAMGFVLDGKVGETIIESRGLAHHIAFRADPILQEPRIDPPMRKPSEVRIGTKVTVRWPHCARSILDDAKARFLLLAEGFGWFNPHLDLTVDWDGEGITTWPAWPASDPYWNKWRPCDPTSAHWYDEARLRRLMAAQIADGLNHNREPRFVRDFIGEFRGLSGSAKKKAVLEAVGAVRMTLPDFFASGSIADLLTAMQDNSRPVQPKELGEIGKDHFAACFKANRVDPETFDYKRIYGISEGLPYVVEAAFGYRKVCEGRLLVSGVNWSPAIVNPFRQLGGYYESLDSVLAGQHCGQSEPLAFALHLSSPRIGFTDHGKSAVAIDAMVANAIKEAVLAVTKKWSQQRERETRDARAEENRAEKIKRTENDEEKRNRRAEQIEKAEAVRRVLETAYKEVTQGETIFVDMRDLYYQVRPLYQQFDVKPSKDKYGRESSALDYKYFSQTVVPDYRREVHPLEMVDYKARGFLYSPHTEEAIEIGDKELRTFEFPEHEYNKILVIEKAGVFKTLMQTGGKAFAKRHDLAIIANEGFGTEAVRKLLAKARKHDMQIFVWHDADPSGYEICRTLGEATKRMPGHRIEIFDLGLTIDDAREMGIDTEKFTRKAALSQTLVPRLTPEEKRLFTGTPKARGAGKFIWIDCERVEINAIPIPERVGFLERKLAQIPNLLGKVIPPAPELKDHALAISHSQARYRIEAEIRRRIDVDGIAAAALELLDRPEPFDDDTPRAVKERLEIDPCSTWLAALSSIVASKIKIEAGAVEKAVDTAIKSAMTRKNKGDER